MFQLSVFVQSTHFHKRKRQDVQTCWNTQRKTGTTTQTNKQTIMQIQVMREREKSCGRESALFCTPDYAILPPLWASPLPKPGIRCVWACVCLCTGRVPSWVWHMFGECPDLLWSDQYYCLQSLLQVVRPCLYPFPQVSTRIPSTITWSKMTRSWPFTFLKWWSLLHMMTCKSDKFASASGCSTEHRQCANYVIHAEDS